jgi:putative iron-regulated protein
MALSASTAIAATGPAFDAALSPAIRDYTAVARREYAAAHTAVQALRDSIRAFNAAPSAATLDAARRAWIRSHERYGRTEVFRFAGGPIDGVQPKTGAQGPEGRINAWPVDEAYLDYVAGGTTGGLIANLEAPMTAETLIGRNAA